MPLVCFVVEVLPEKMNETEFISYISSLPDGKLRVDFLNNLKLPFYWATIAYRILNIK